MKREEKIIMLLRVGIAFSFLYAAFGGFLNPNSWIGFIPAFMTSILPAKTILVMFGVTEVLVALGLLFMKNPFWPAVLSGLMLLGIIVFNLPQFEILFRDVPIVLMSVALAVYFYKPLEVKINKEKDE